MTSTRMQLPTTVLGALLVATGCPSPQGRTDVLELDVGTYEAYVHPLFEGSCATLDCHGDEGRPLRLYSETGLRIRDDLRTPPGVATTPVIMEELTANVQSIQAIDPDNAYPDSRVLLLKPLSNVGGGLHHFGGRIWLGDQDPAYLCVRSWMFRAIDTDACATAAARDGLPPP